MPSQLRIWKSAFGVNTVLTGNQDQAKVFQLANGDFWVTWRDFQDAGSGTQEGSDVFGQRYDALGQAQGGPVRMNAYFSDDNEGRADFAAFGSSFFTVYQDTDIPGGYADLILERHPADGSPDAVRIIALDPTGDNTGANLSDPQIAIGSATNGVVVFERRTGGSVDFVARFFNPTTLEIGAEVRLVSPPGGQLRELIVTGNLYRIIWEEFNAATSFDVKRLPFQQNGEFVSAFGPSEAGSQSLPTLVRLTGGEGIEAYVIDDPTHGQTVQIERGGESQITVNAPATRPALAATSDGGFVVAWVHPTTGEVKAQSYRLAPNGAPEPVGDAISVGVFPGAELSFTALADGRVLLGIGGADVYAVILDPRAAINATPAYTPEDRQVGMSGNDVFTTNATADIVNGWDGNDTITEVAGGTSRIFGDAGDDRIILNGVSSAKAADGGTGTDTLVLTTANQVFTPVTISLALGTLQSGTQTQIAANFENFEYNAGAPLTVIGTAGANRITTGGGSDTIMGGDGDDVVRADSGLDIVEGGAGNDDLNGGSNIDTASYANAPTAVTVSFAISAPQNTGGAGTDTLSEFENLLGSAFNDTLTGNNFANTLDGGAGADALAGGLGDDVYVVDQLGDIVTENANAGTDEIRTTLAVYALDTVLNVENLRGSDGANDLRGTDTANVINGLGGDDFLDGRDGNDTLIAGAGTDDLRGGAGDDGLFFGADFTTADYADGGAGTNDQLGLQGAYAALSLDPARIVNVEVIALLQYFDYNLTALNGFTSLLTIQATQLTFGDNFTFNGSASTAGAFLIYGGLGVENLTGGGADDGFYFGNGRFASGDFVNGGAGTNDQLGLDGNYGTSGTPFTLSGTQIQNIEVIALLSGNAGPFTHYLDTNESLVANGQTLTIFGLQLPTGLTFSGVNETDGGKFKIYGGTVADTLTGGTGDDWLFGGLGGDSLAGGGGADIFFYDDVAQSTGPNHDRLIGFNDAVDKIDLAFAVTGFAAPQSGSLDSVDGLQSAFAALGNHQAGVFTANDGALNGRTFLVVDADGVAGYQAGADFLFEIVSPVTAIDQSGLFI